MIAAVNGYAFAAGLETALLADIRIAAENAEFGALERRWNIVGGDGMTVAAAARGRVREGDGADHHRPPHRRARGRADRARERGGAARARRSQRAQELAHEIAALPQGAIRSDKESVMRGIGRTLEERLRIEAEMTLSMFMRRDKHTIGARPRSSAAT